MSLTVGQINPLPWQQPRPKPYENPSDRNQQVGRRIQTPTPARLPLSTYANECIITRGDHDAVMRFYLVREGSKSLLAEVTVPLSLLPPVGVTA